MDLLRRPKAKAIRRTSGGIGKKDASTKDNRNNARGPYGVSPQVMTQSYNLRICLNMIKKSPFLN